MRNEMDHQLVRLVANFSQLGILRIIFGAIALSFAFFVGIALVFGEDIARFVNPLDATAASVYVSAIAVVSAVLTRFIISLLEDFRSVFRNSRQTQIGSRDKDDREVERGGFLDLVIFALLFAAIFATNVIYAYGLAFDSSRILAGDSLWYQPIVMPWAESGLEGVFLSAFFDGETDIFLILFAILSVFAYGAVYFFQRSMRLSLDAARLSIDFQQEEDSDVLVVDEKRETESYRENRRRDWEERRTHRRLRHFRDLEMLHLGVGGSLNRALIFLFFAAVFLSMLSMALAGRSTYCVESSTGVARLGKVPLATASGIVFIDENREDRFIPFVNLSSVGEALECS